MEYVGTSLGKDSALTLLEAPGGEREPVEGDFIMDTWGKEGEVFFPAGLLTSCL